MKTVNVHGRIAKSAVDKTVGDAIRLQICDRYSSLQTGSLAGRLPYLTFVGCRGVCPMYSRAYISRKVSVVICDQCE